MGELNAKIGLDNMGHGEIWTGSNDSPIFYTACQYIVGGSAFPCLKIGKVAGITRLQSTKSD